MPKKLTYEEELARREKRAAYMREYNRKKNQAIEEGIKDKKDLDIIAPAAEKLQQKLKTCNAKVKTCKEDNDKKREENKKLVTQLEKCNQQVKKNLEDYNKMLDSRKKK